MQQGGFLAQRNRNPAGLAAVVALHGAALSALILFPPKFIIKEMPTFIVDSIPADKPPPPVPDTPPPPQQAVTRPESVVTTTTTVRPVDLTRIVDDPGPIVVTPRIEPAIVPVKPEPVLTEATVDPRAAFQPDYPPRLARQDIAGKAVVRVLIGADGRVKAVEMVSATDPAFFEATRKQALRFWRFKPATRDGVAVESWRTMTVRFEMKA